MHINSHYRPGFRALKSAISVFLCLLVCFILGHTEPFFACIAAIICLQHTYDETMKEGYYRLLGTLLGGIIGYMILKVSEYIPLYTEGVYMIVTPLCVLLAIYVCNIINHTDAVSICCVVVLGILLDNNRGAYDTLIYVVTRVINTSIGVIIAVLVDRYIFPRKQITK